MAAIAASPNPQPITAQDILTRNLQALFKQFGLDPNGNNEEGAIARELQQALLPVVASQYGLQNQLIPATEQAVTSAAQSFTPEGRQAIMDERNAQLDQQGAQQGQINAAKVAAAGGSPQAAAGAALASRNAATTAENAYGNNLYSPTGNLEAAQGLTGLQNGLSGPLTQQGLQLGNFVEMRHDQNQQEQQNGTFGQIAGLLGGALGKVNWGSIFKNPGTGVGLGTGAGIGGAAAGGL